MPIPAIDALVFAELQQSAGADFVVELVGSFLEDAPQGLAALRAAVAAGDAAAFRRHAHTLKSNGTAFGALTFADAARALEQTPLADLGTMASVRVAELASLYDAAATELRRLCHA